MMNAKQSSNNRFLSLLIIAVAIILILIGIGYMSLTFAGKAVTAQVTGYEQVMFVNNDDSTRNPSRYKLEYRLTAGEKSYTGSVTRIFERGSHIRQTIPVRYLFFWPHVNAEDGKTAVYIGPVMAGLGVMALVFGLRKKSRSRNKANKRFVR